MAYETKDGNFACFLKTSKAGGQYFNGKVILQGKEYSISIFEKVSRKGDKYLSGIIDEQTRGQQETPAPAIKKVDSFNEDFLNDEIPFNLSRINGDYK